MLTLYDLPSLCHGRIHGKRFLGTCPVCGYKNALSASEKNGYLLLYCHAGHCDYKEIIRHLGVTNYPVTFATAATINQQGKNQVIKPHDMSRQKYVETLWAETIPAEHTPVQNYLIMRGLKASIPKDIRFHPHLKHGPSNQYWPAMVAAVRSLSGELVGVHRTFLNPDGNSKAPITPTKLSLGKLSGCSVQLKPAKQWLGLAEGLETALSVLNTVDFPIWACLSTAGLQAIQLPEIVQSLIIFADHDPPGLKAAYQTADYWCSQGMTVKVVTPPNPGEDFNDFIQVGGTSLV